MDEIKIEPKKKKDRPYYFKKGNPGGPGRPKNKSLYETLRENLNKKMKLQGGKEITKMEAVIKVLVNEALKGESWAHTIIWDRIEGRVPTPITGAKGEPLIPRQTIDLSGWDDEMLVKFLTYLEKKRIDDAKNIQENNLPQTPNENQIVPSSNINPTIDTSSETETIESEEVEVIETEPVNPMESEIIEKKENNGLD